MAASARTLLLICGSTRKGSVNGAVLATAATVVPTRWTGTIYPGLERLPHFNPDVEQTGPPPAVLELRAAIATADALLFCTPEYAGTMPGALKNLLEWSIGDTVMTDKPVGWINPSTALRQAAGTYAALRTVLSYTGASLVTDACVDIPVARALIGEAGTVEDPAARDEIRRAVRALATHVDA